MNPYGGRMGAGFGRGRGRWWGAPPPTAGSWAPAYGGYPYAPAYSAEQEKEALQNQAKFLEDQLKALREHIEELEADTSKKK
jgi:hypothetical protein